MWILFLFGKGCFQGLILYNMPMKKFKLWSWIVCSFLLLFLGATFVFHQFSLRNESKLLTPIGKTSYSQWTSNECLC